MSSNVLALERRDWALSRIRLASERKMAILRSSLSYRGSLYEGQRRQNSSAALPLPLRKASGFPSAAFVL